MKWDIRDALRRFGPGSPDGVMSQMMARSYCAWLTRSHYENFSVASVLLPRRLLPHFHAVYAYCRWADDLADAVGDQAESLRLLHWWREELIALYAGRPRHPVMVALQGTVQKFAIPITPFEDLLSAFEQDQRVTEYETFSELHAYCRRSANPVGRIVLHLFGCPTPERMALADAVCTGLQLANFWQDVSRDWDMRRLYLPHEDRERFGYLHEDLHARRCTPAFRELMRFQVERARDFLHRGHPLVDHVPRPVQLDLELFVQGGLTILDAITQQDYDVWTHRPVVSKWDKLRLLGRAILKLGYRGIFDRPTMEDRKQEDTYDDHRRPNGHAHHDGDHPEMGGSRTGQ